jgi:hypothetical protein
MWRRLVSARPRSVTKRVAIVLAMSLIAGVGTLNGGLAMFADDVEPKGVGDASLLPALASDEPPRDELAVSTGDFGEPPATMGRQSDHFDEERSVVVARQKKSTRYRNPDGTETLRMYTEPRNFREQGVWKEIDPTLEQTADGDYRNTQGPATFSFPDRTDADDKLSIADEDWSVAFGTTTWGVRPPSGRASRAGPARPSTPAGASRSRRIQP